MFSWFTEYPIPLYVILGIVGIVSMLTFYSTGRAVYWWGVGGAVVLAFLVWLTDYLVVTDREQVEENTYALIEAVEKGELRRFDEFVSRDFAIPEDNITREKLMNSARPYFGADPRRRVRVSQMEVLPGEKPGEYVCDGMVQATGHFGQYGEASGEVVRVKLTFKKDADSKWRVRHYSVFWFGTRLSVPQ